MAAVWVVWSARVNLAFVVVVLDWWFGFGWEECGVVVRSRSYTPLVMVRCVVVAVQQLFLLYVYMLVGYCGVIPSFSYVFLNYRVFPVIYYS